MIDLKAVSLMNKVVQYFGSDVKRINHSLKVYSYSQLITGKEGLNGEILDITIYSSLLHDIGIKEAERKYNSSAGKYQELEGPNLARKFLLGLNISQEIIKRVCYLVGNHHTYNKIDGIDFQILVESDFLVNIFEEGLSEAAINNIGHTIFKTDSGIKLLETMFEFSP